MSGPFQVAGAPDYDMLRELGRGGNGVVVLARHRALDRLVAIKRLRYPTTRSHGDSRRLVREARALAQLSHPGIVRLYDLVETDGEVLVVMEYVEGLDLRTLAASTDLPPSRAIPILSDLADAIDHAHEHGVVHRDVKPANVLIDQSGRAKLADFGLARLLHDVSAFRTNPGTVMGSVAYLAPEQILGDPSVGAPVDAYAFSAVAYELLTGQRPFAEMDTRALLDAHLFTSPRPAGDLVPGFPEIAAHALAAGLAKRTDERATVRSVIAALVAVPITAWPPKPTAKRPPPGDPPQTAQDTVATIHSAPTPTNEDAIATPPARQNPRGALSFPDPQQTRRVEPPVYQPAPPRVGTRRPHLVVIAVGVALAIAILGLALRSLTSTTASKLAVTQASVTVTPHNGHCPGTTFVFVASVVTNATAGTAHVRWTVSHNERAATQELPLPSGTRHATATFRYTLRGTGDATETATIHVTAPASDIAATSPTIRYTCP